MPFCRQTWSGNVVMALCQGTWLGCMAMPFCWPTCSGCLVMPLCHGTWLVCLVTPFPGNLCGLSSTDILASSCVLYYTGVVALHAHHCLCYNRSKSKRVCNQNFSMCSETSGLFWCAIACPGDHMEIPREKVLSYMYNMQSKNSETSIVLQPLIKKISWNNSAALHYQPRIDPGTSGLSGFAIHTVSTGYCLDVRADIHSLHMRLEVLQVLPCPRQIQWLDFPVDPLPPWDPH
jgi:hypothetical protein